MLQKDFGSKEDSGAHEEGRTKEERRKMAGAQRAHVLTFEAIPNKKQALTSTEAARQSGGSESFRT